MAVQSYERGSQAVILAAATAAAGDKQVGNAAPVNANVFGLPPTVSRGQLPFNFVLQIDISGGTVSAIEVDVLGSIDGVNFYVVSKITTGLSGSINFIGGAALRYLTAAVPTLTIGSGAPVAKISFAG